MRVQPYECDRDRLRLSLADRLTEDQQAALADHVEQCPGCRRDLEQMAAASGYWGDAALLRGELAPGESPTVGIVDEGARDLEGEEETGDLDAALLHFLDPPEETRPETLGRLGSYEVLEVLGRGGMGVVLKARDPSLDRTVAIKVLTPTLAVSATARRRFAREARAIATVGHEHIVAIFAVDEFHGLPYLVMQYIPGRSLQQRLDASGPLEVREILRIGTQAARALAAAHAQGVVHRDVKPANILLENCVERVKLTDFGLARAIDDASLTQSGVIAGTPQYMAPEQARGEPVDARADLFALGAALYAMAAGRSPFRADSAMAVLKRVCDVGHRPIRQLNPDVPVWLEAAIDRLLAKEPADRFQTAAEVAELLEQGLAHLQQPTILPAPSVAVDHTHRAKSVDLDPLMIKPRHRHRRRLSLAAALVLLTVAGLGVSEAAGLTQVSDFVATILRIKMPDGTLIVKVDDPDIKVQIDDETVIIGGGGRQEVRLYAGSHRVRMMKDGKKVSDKLVTITRGGKEIVNVDFEPAAEKVIREPGDARLRLKQEQHASEASTHQNGSTRDAQPGPGGIRFPTFGGGTPDGKTGTAQQNKTGARVDQGAQSPLSKPAGPGDPARIRAMVWCLAFSPDGGRLAIGHQGIDRPESVLRVWDLKQGSDAFWFQHPAGYRSVAFSSDGRTLAAGNFDGTLTFYTADDEILHSENQGSPINCLVFLPNTKTVAAGDWDGWVRFHGADAIANRRPLKYPGKIWTIAVSPDGSTLAAGGEAGTIQVFDLPTRQLKATLEGHNHVVESVDFSPDGKLLASGGGNSAKIWDTSTWRLRSNVQHFPEVISVRFSPDGKLLAIGDGESYLPHYNVLPTQIILWDVATQTEVRRLRGHINTIWALAFSPDGKTLASGSADQTVKFWDTGSGRLRETIIPGESGTASGPGAVSESTSHETKEENAVTP